MRKRLFNRKKIIRKATRAREKARTGQEKQARTREKTRSEEKHQVRSKTTKAEARQKQRSMSKQGNEEEICPRTKQKKVIIDGKWVL